MNALLILKIAGLIVGVVAAARGKRGDPNSARERRLTLSLVFLGFGTALIAELVSASQNQKAALQRQHDADEALKRNNGLLAEIQRTLHPLFPLNVEVSLLAPLTQSETQRFRKALEDKFTRDSPQNPGVPIVWLHPEDSMFPACQRDRPAYQIVTAELQSMVRLYSRERTRAHLEKHEPLNPPDVEFFPSAQRDPSGPAFERSEDRLARIVENRDYEFHPKQGLHISDGGQRIEFDDTKNTTDMVSADDLLGATIEVAVSPFDRSDDSCGPIPPALDDMVGFESIAITLPGSRRLVVNREKFGPPTGSGEWPFSYQFTFPAERGEFERLFQSGSRWETGAPRGVSNKLLLRPGEQASQQTGTQHDHVTAGAPTPGAFIEDDELAFRISQLLTGLRQLVDPRNRRKLQAGKSAADVDALLKRFGTAGGFPHRADQFKDVSPARLLAQLRPRITDRATLSDIDRAAGALADWNAWIGSHSAMLSDPWLLGGAIIDELVLPRWRSLYPFLDCPSSAPFC